MFTPIRPPPDWFKMASKLSANLQDALDESAEDARELLLRPTSTWKSGVRFIITKTPQGREVFTTEKPYLYLTRGTRVRYATMTPGFMAKTKVGVLSSGVGKGGVLFISRKHPRPGIKAMGYEELVVDEMKKTMPKIVNAAFRKALGK